MKSKTTVIIICAIICTLKSLATDYSQLELKASRFYSQQEWASASAMYGLMIDRRPDVPSTYGRAIVASAMQGAPVADRMTLLSRSIEARIPLDSIFAVICTNAFDLGKACVYEDFLINVKQQYPWMTRTIDNYLLQYYTFRSDGQKMIEYSRIMLDGMPHNTLFLSSLAQGYLLDGQYSEAMATYKTLLEYTPHNYTALLYLGNYYSDMAHNRHSDTEARLLARQYLSEANRLHPTPYVTRLLADPLLSE